MSRKNSPIIQLNFDAYDVKEDKENEKNFGPDAEVQQEGKKSTYNNIF